MRRHSAARLAPCQSLAMSADFAAPRWLVLRDMFHNVLDSTELVAGTDLRRAFGEGLATLEREGVDAFSGSYHDALNTLEKKAREIT